MPSDPGMAPGTVRQVPDPRLNGMRLDFQRFYRRPGHGGRHPRNAVYNRNVDSENPLRADDRNPRGRHRADPHRGRIYRHHRERSHVLTVNPFKAVLFVIFLLILQQVEGGRLCCPLTPEGYTALQN